MKKIIGLILVSIYFTGCFFAKGNNKEELVDEMIALIEYAYMEEQRGVLEDEIVFTSPGERHPRAQPSGELDATAGETAYF